MSSTPEKAKKTEKKPSVPYKMYIVEAITELKSKTGSSMVAIEKYIKEHHTDVELNHSRVRNIIKMMLKNNEIAPHYRHTSSYRLVPKAAKKTTKRVTKKAEKAEKEEKTEKKEKKTEKKTTKKAEKKEKAEKKTTKKTEKKEKKPAKKTEKKEKAEKPKKAAKKTEKAKKAEKKSA